MQYQNLKYAVDWWNVQNKEDELSLEIVTANAYVDVIDRGLPFLLQNSEPFWFLSFWPLLPTAFSYYHYSEPSQLPPHKVAHGPFFQGPLKKPK